ncbi:16S rRNA (guanine(527)-N(7))-methyltransferase RsmG [candidate division NPL-UPA2 bacterium]|nr:16S rRNA (guanine(527)-N(7))-methyltransferase RsmG [candidate division NPL-UPA2 bacterium]
MTVRQDTAKLPNCQTVKLLYWDRPMDNELRNLLREGAAEVGAPLEEEQAGKLLLHLKMIREWNKKINLTSTSDCRQLLLKHFIDSLTCIPLLPARPQIRLIDVGTGAGFPGVVLKVYRPDIELALLDSSGKRCAFLSHLLKKLGLNKTRVFGGRAEDYGREPEHRESYDVAVSRAVAHLRILVEYGLPFLRLGGLFICQKGPKGREEIKEAGEAVSLLGGEISGTRAITLPEVKEKRLLISITKIKLTPIKYPRRPGRPRKSPL